MSWAKKLSVSAKRWSKIIKSVGFKGSFADFLHFLRTDPQFTTSAVSYSKKRHLLPKSRCHAAKYFGKLPRKPMVSRQCPPKLRQIHHRTIFRIETAIDEPGYYWVNTYALDKRPLYELETNNFARSRTRSSSAISLNSELTSLPDFPSLWLYLCLR